MFKVKICGITRASDAVVAAQHGADLIGVIFAKRSPRLVSAEQAVDIVEAVPPTIMTVGVFEKATAREIVSLYEQLRFDFAQLHDSDETVVQKLQRWGIKVIVCFGASATLDKTRLTESAADVVMLDNEVQEKSGGTGRTFDWRIKLPHGVKNVMISGGLNSSNVELAIKRFRPLIVDVSSGVETRPGVKSAAKIRSFLAVCNKLRYGTKR